MRHRRCRRANVSTARSTGQTARAVRAALALNGLTTKFEAHYITRTERAAADGATHKTEDRPIATKRPGKRVSRAPAGRTPKCVAPTLIKKLPLPLRKLVGDMHDPARVLIMLGVTATDEGLGR